MIRLCNRNEMDEIYQIINDAATAFKGIIPDDRYHGPDISMNELEKELDDGVVFWGYTDSMIK